MAHRAGVEDLDADLGIPSPRRADVWHLRLSMRRPMVASHGTTAHREVTLVRLVEADGLEGWGECSALNDPTYTAEWAAGAFDVLERRLLPAVLAGAAVGGAAQHPMAAAAVEMALVDLSLRRRGRSLAEVLGSTSRAVPWCGVVGRHDDPEALLNEVDLRVRAGAAMVKLKVAPGHDLAPLAVVRQAFAEVPLAVDANGAYDADPAGAAALLDQGLVYVEQPVAARALRRSAQVSAAGDTPVALDESITGVDALDSALTLRAGSVVNLKPARLGGFGPALACIARLRADGAGCFVGGMLETGLGRAAALALAGCPAMTLPTDLGPSWLYLPDDVVEPLGTDLDGKMLVPPGPGLGRRPDVAMVERHALAHEVLRA